MADRQRQLESVLYAVERALSGDEVSWHVEAALRAEGVGRPRLAALFWNAAAGRTTSRRRAASFMRAAARCERSDAAPSRPAAEGSRP